jgi:phosphonate transport system ATP-binding protein
MFRLDNLTVRYPKTEQDALVNVSTTFSQGDFVCILGRSGAGKSTLIRCLNGLQTYTGGSIRWNDREIAGLSEEEIRIIRREMGMIFQHFHLIPRLSVFQNVITGLFGYRGTMRNLLGLFTEEEKSKTKQVIENMELLPQINQRVERLSGGQKQRVAIARALLQKPKVFLGDEPVASLDPGTADRIFQLLKDIHEKQGLLTVINVHNVEIAKKFATRILALKEGELIFDSAPENFAEGDFSFVYE